jgi:Tfp pilus assembly protein PilF
MILTYLLAAAVGASQCGELVKNDAGGDYTNPADRQKLAVVENFHFTPSVARLMRGTSGTLGGDIGYTLEHFPNHHRALAAMAKLGTRDKSAQPQGARYSIDCFFDRAVRFSPADGTVRTLYGGHLLSTERPELAMVQFKQAVTINPANANSQYNLGLLYLKQKDYALAREHARHAYTLGFPLPGLKNQLKQLKQWQEED